MNNNSQNFGYISVDHFKYEGFRSGALISVRETLRHIQNMGYNAEFISLAHKDTLVLPNSLKIIDSIGEYKGLKIHEIQVGEDNNKESIDNIIKQAIDKFNLDIILIESPSVELRGFDLTLIKALQCYSKKVLMLVQDELYPNYTLGRDEDLVSKYLDEMRRIKLLCPTASHKDLINRTIGLNAEVIPNILDVESIITDVNFSEYITLVNPIKLKGILIFEEIARKMPNLKFLTVESWKQERRYESNIGNIHSMDYTQDPREIYKKTKILLVPSLIKEGGPRVIIEALLNNIPVIGHDIGGIKNAGKGLIHLIQPPSNIGGSSIEPEISDEEISSQAEMFASKINYILSCNEKSTTSEKIIIENNKAIFTLENIVSKEILLDNDKENIKKITNFLNKIGISKNEFDVKIFVKGKNNSIYQLKIGLKYYCCRINNSENIGKKNKLVRREIEILKLIEEIDIGPKLFNFDIENQLIIVEFINGNIRKNIEDIHIMKIANNLSRLHSYKEYNNHGYLLENAIYKNYDFTILLNELYYAAIKIISKNKYINNNIKLIIKKIYEKLYLELSSIDYKRNHYVIIHGDLKNENIIFSGDDVIFIDWECGHIEVPEVDIAKIISTYSLNSEQRELLLKNYKGEYSLSLVVSYKKVFDFYDIILKYKHSLDNSIKLLENELNNFINNI